MEITVIGIDLAKDVFQLHGVDSSGKTTLTRKLRRAELCSFMARLKPCRVGLESCGGAHYWAREFKEMGHEVKLIAPQFVKPFVKSNKNDAKDAEAIAEAVQRPNMRFVTIKEMWQQDVQILHRTRARLVRQRTALTNELRGFLHEYGIVFPKTTSKLASLLIPRLDANEKKGTALLRKISLEFLDELRALEARISSYDQQIEAFFRSSEPAKRIEKIPGVGKLTATAIVAAVGNASGFKNGRQLSAYLGLVPKQHSSGGKSVLLGISKRGDPYLRSLLVHGARAVLRQAPGKTDAKSRWALLKAEKRGANKACVALANKNARIIWALLARGEEYRMAA
jgi:transposase